MKTLRSKLTVVFAFFAVVALAFGIGFMPKQASAAVDTSTGFYIEDGASIRTEVGESGIKWTAHISETKYAELNTEANSVVAIGIAIQPQGNTDSKLDIHYEYGYDSFEIAFTEGDFEYSYAIYYDDLIADIEAIKGDLDTDAEKEYLLKAYQTELEARPFVKHADGTYTYGEYFDTARSLQGVAVGTLVAGTYAEGSAEDTLLKSFLPNGYELADTEYVADSYYSNYDAWGNIAIDSAIPMANATPADEDSRATTRVYYRGNDVTDAYNPATGLLELTAEDKVSTSITTDGSANEYLVIYDEVTGMAYKQSFVGVTLAINDVADLDYFKLKSKVWWGGNGTGEYGAWEWWFEDTTDYIWDGYYVLLNNIDATGYTHDLDNGMAFNATGDKNQIDFTTNVYGSYVDYLGGAAGLYRNDIVYGFSGTFDGLGHTISNMNTDKTGLFGHILGGTVKNLGMDNWTANSTTAGRLAFSIARNGKLENIFVNTAPLIVGGGYSAPVVPTIGSTVHDIKNVVVFDNTTYMTSYAWQYYTGSLTGDFERKADYLTVPFNAFDGYYVVSNKALIEIIPANADPTTGKQVLLDAEYIDGVKNEAVYTFTYSLNGVTVQPTKELTAQVGTRRYTSLAEFKKDAKNLDFSSFDSKYWTILEGIPRFVSTLKLDNFVVTLNGSNIYNIENNQTYTIDATYEGATVPNLRASIVSGEGATLNGLELTVTKVGAVVINVQGAQLSKNITINVNPEIIETDKQYNFSGVDGLFFDDNFNVVSISTVFEDINNVTNVVDHNGKTLTITEDGALLGMDTSAKDWEAGYVIFYTADAGYKVFLNVAELIIDEATDFAFFGLKNPVTGSIIPAEGEAIFDGYYVLSKNIDMSSYTHQFAGTSGVSFSPTNFTKVTGLIAEGGDLYGKYLTGTFDGQGYTISNFGMDATTANAGGLLGYINGGTVKNLAITARAAASNGTTCSAYSGVIAGGIMGDAVLSDLYIYVKGSRNNSDSTGLITGGITSSVTLTRLVVVWESTKNMPIGAGVLVDDASTTALLNANMTDCYFIADIPAALAATADANTTTTKLDDGTVATGKRYHKVSADAKYVDDVENTTKTAKTFHQAWSLTSTVSTDAYEINLNGKTVYNAPYEIEIFEGLKRYTTTGKMNTATALANNDFSNWPGVWTIISGAPYFTSNYTLSNYTATLNGGAYSETSNVVDRGAVNTVKMNRGDLGELVNKPSLEVVSGKDIVTVDGNTFKGIANGDAVIKVVFGPVSHLIPVTVINPTIVYEHEYQFSATDGVIFNGENVVALDSIIGDGEGLTKVTDKDGNELTLSEGKILGMTTSTKDWEDNKLYFYLDDSTLIVNVKVAELIIDEKEDFAYFTLKHDWDYAKTTNWTYTFHADDFEWHGYYVLAKNIDATGYSHDLGSGLGKYSNGVTVSCFDDLGYANRLDYTGGFKNNTKGFKGVFDGQGYAISNLTTNRFGLLGMIFGGKIQNLGMINCNNGATYYAPLAWGIANGSSIENVYVEMPTRDNFAGGEYAPLVSSWTYTVYDVKNFVVVDNNTYPNAAAGLSYIGSLTTDTTRGDSAATEATTFGTQAGVLKPYNNVILVSPIPMSVSVSQGAMLSSGTTTMDAEYIDGNLNENTYTITNRNSAGSTVSYPVQGVRRYSNQGALYNDLANITTQLKQLTDTTYFTVSADGVIGWAKA